MARDTSFYVVTCDDGANEDFVLAAEKGYLRTVVVGERKGGVTYSGCSMFTNVPWDSLGHVETLALIGTSVTAPAEISLEEL